MRVDEESSTAVMAAILGIILIVMIVVGGYLGGWWLKNDVVNRQNRLDQNSYGRQNSLVESINDDIREISAPSVGKSQRSAITAQICDNASKLNGSIPLAYNTQVFIQENC